VKWFKHNTGGAGQFDMRSEDKDRIMKGMMDGVRWLPNTIHYLENTKIMIIKNGMHICMRNVLTPSLL
jgi:hypothetical protein